MKRKVIYNREKLSSDEIRKHREFDTLLKSIEDDSNVYWKSIRFWGTVGASAVALFLIINMF